MKRSYRIGTTIVAAALLGGAVLVLAATQGAGTRPASVSAPQQDDVETAIGRLRAEAQALRSQVSAAEQARANREASVTPEAVPVQRPASSQPSQWTQSIQSTERPDRGSGEHRAEPSEHEHAAGEHDDDE